MSFNSVARVSRTNHISSCGSWLVTPQCISTRYSKRFSYLVDKLRRPLILRYIDEVQGFLISCPMYTSSQGIQKPTQGLTSLPTNNVGICWPFCALCRPMTRGSPITGVARSKIKYRDVQKRHTVKRDKDAQTDKIPCWASFFLFSQYHTPFTPVTRKIHIHQLCGGIRWIPNNPNIVKSHVRSFGSWFWPLKH